MSETRKFNFRGAPAHRVSHKAKMASDFVLAPLPSGRKTKCVDCGGEGRVCPRCNGAADKHVHMPVICKSCKGAGST